MEALPDADRSRGRDWTADEDKAIVEFYPKKNKRELARALHSSENTVRNRYRFLTGK